jgi:3-dehydroquinate synthase II
VRALNRERIAIAPVAPGAEERKEIIRRAARHGFDRFVLADASEAPEGAVEVLHRAGPDRLEWLRPADHAPLPIFSLADPEDLPKAIALGRARNGVAITWRAERVIPLENLLADAHGHYPVWVVLDRLRDVPAMLGALEHGADRVVVEIAEVEQLEALESALDEPRGVTIPWEIVPITRVLPAGIGDRVIVDTTSLLRPGEGILVGSAAAFLLHVASEAVGSRFTRPRPFRVNAGAAHSYALLADGTTRYLSELVAGDAVLAVEPNGTPRSVRVGRIKIERRPMVMIEIERKGRRYTTFLQEAETVRLSGETDRVATTHLEAGQRVFGAPFPPARHLGGVVEETIEER